MNTIKILKLAIDICPCPDNNKHHIYTNIMELPSSYLFAKYVLYYSDYSSYVHVYNWLYVITVICGINIDLILIRYESDKRFYA